MPTYIWTGTISSDWGTSNNWNPAAPSGGPSLADDVVFNNSVNCTTGTTARSCNTLNTTGYTGTLTIGASTAGTLRVNGNVTIGNTVNHIAGLANLIITATATLDVATGVTIPNLEFTNTAIQTITLSRTTTVTNLLKQGSTSTTVTAGSAGILLNISNGTVKCQSGTLTIGSNVTLTINGSSSVSSPGLNFTGALNVPLGNTLTLNATLTFVGASTFTCAGTFTPGTQTVILPSAAITINLGSNSFYNLSYGAGVSTIVTMLSNINVTNNLALSGISNFNGAFDITVGGNLSGGTLANSTAGRKISLTGTSTGTSTITSIGLNNITLEINCTTNNFVLTGIITSTNSTVNYLATNSGGFTTTGSTLSYSGSLTINMNGKTNSWNTISNNSGIVRTLTLISDVYCTTIGPTASDSINTSTLNVLGNITSLGSVTGTSTIALIGNTSTTFQTVSPANTVGVNLTVNKLAGATVTFLSSFNWGAANRTLNLNTAANFTTNSTTLTLAGTPLTILNASNSQFWNLTTAATAQTINLN